MPLLLLIGLGLGFWWLKSKASPAVASKGVLVTDAASLAVVLRGGTSAQKQAAVMHYEKLKGLPVTGLYTVAIAHAMQDDGVTNPPPVPAGTTDE